MKSEVVPSRSATVAADDLNGVLRDYMVVTQRLQQTHEALQREVLRLRNEVESKDRELERRRRLASLGELAAGVAHEVRNPLGAIRLYSGLLRGQLGDRGAALDLVEKIDAGVCAIDCVVQDTLALVPRPGRLKRVSLRQILGDACDACRATLESQRVTLEAHAPHGDAEVLAEAAALRRVFVNLIANAAQASPEAGVVTVSIRHGRKGHVSVNVCDDGLGLCEDIMDKVFDPFFTTKENGTGLGLTIAHRLVEAHGGSLTVRNRAEGGAEFEVLLPLATAQREDQTEEADAERTSAA